MRVFIRDNYDELSSTAARFVCDVIKASESKMVNIAFPGGRSVIGLYRELVRIYGEGGVSFKNVRAFHLDEYVGLREDDEMCQKNWMKEVRLTGTL
jgi:glucosamine-6-phosphate deaminase